MKWNYTFTLLLLLSASFTYAQIIHVPEDFPTIQTAVDAASENDTILINNGTYIENLQVNQALTIASNFIFSGDPLDVENTIVDGNQNGSVFSAQAIQSDTVRFVGLTVTNGNGTLCDPQGVGNEQLHGGGFYIKDVGAIVINNMIIRENHILTSHNSAGGVFYQSSSLWIKNSMVENNLVRGESFLGEGAGLYFYESEARISDSEITGNISSVAYGEGGGIYAKYSVLEIINTSISNNENIDAGAMYLADSDTEIHGCTINNNLAHHTGGISVFNSEDHNFLMSNTTVNWNVGSNDIGAIKLYFGSAEIINCEINDNVGGYSTGAISSAGS